LLTAAGPQLIDCPMTRAAAGTALIWTGQRAGATGYLAPEQLAGRAIFPSVDVFGLGSLAAYASLGRPPFGEDGDAEILYRILHGQPDLGYSTPPLRGLIERCLAKQAGQRPGPAAVIGACRAAAAGTGSQPAQPWLPPKVAALLPRYAAPPAPSWAATGERPSRRAGPRPSAVPARAGTARHRAGADAVA
ncbi:MAG TPA: serine/threonine protein kinase, partial [Streptosporangiaceae bacterium]